MLKRVHGYLESDLVYQTQNTLCIPYNNVYVYLCISVVGYLRNFVRPLYIAESIRVGGGEEGYDGKRKFGE